MASEIRVDKITSLSGVGTISPSPTGVEIAGITTTATLKATTGIVTTLTATTGIVTNFTANAVNIGIDTGVYGEDLVVTGNTRVTGITTFGDSDNPALMLNIDATSGFPAISIPDKIIHSGDTDTAIRFPGADQISFETGGTQHMIIGTGGAISITDTIQHTGDTNTKIRFPENDHISFETTGSEAMRIDNGGKLLIGLDDRRLFATGHTSQLQIEGTSGTLNSSLSIVNNQNTTGSPNIRLGKTRGTSIGSNTTVANGDSLGQIIFYGADGTDIYNATALIGAKVNGTVGTDTIPTDLVLETSATTGSGRAERLRILSSGGLTFNGDTATANALDDYEEGVYTPTLTGSGGGSYTLDSSYASLAYTKIGRIMHITGRLRLSAKSSGFSGDYIKVTLPTTSNVLTGYGDAGRVTGTVYVQSSGKAVNDFVILPTMGGNSYLFLAHVDFDGTAFNNMNSQMSGNELISINVTYVSQ